MRSNSHSITVTILGIQFSGIYYIHNIVQPSPLSSSRKFPSLQKKMPYLLSSHPSPWQSLICSSFINLLILDISCKLDRSHTAKNIDSVKPTEASRWQHYEWNRPHWAHPVLWGPRSFPTSGNGQQQALHFPFFKLTLVYLSFMFSALYFYFCIHHSQVPDFNACPFKCHFWRGLRKYGRKYITLWSENCLIHNYIFFWWERHI